MKNAFAVFGALISMLFFSLPSEAGGMGRLLGGLLARGAVVAAVHSGTSSAAKSYTPDVLTVAQLAQCMKTAARLDEAGDRLEADRIALRAATSEVDLSSSTIEAQRSSLDRRSQAAINAFNAMIDRHNTLLNAAKAKQVDFNSAIDAHNGDVNVYNGDCAKKYYADDLAEAQKLAGISGG